MVGPLLDNEAAGADGLAGKFTEAIHRAIAVPRHIGKQLQRVAADGEAEQFRLRFQLFSTGGFRERN